MNITLICVGKIKERYIREGVDEFTKRLSRFTSLTIKEIKDSNKEKEGEKILDLTSGKKYVALTIDGKTFSSEEFADFIKKCQTDSDMKEAVFVIGGFSGLGDAVVKGAWMEMSLSAMTFTHEMARLFFVEQLYRAFTILNNIGYHK